MKNLGGLFVSLGKRIRETKYLFFRTRNAFVPVIFAQTVKKKKNRKQWKPKTRVVCMASGNRVSIFPPVQGKKKLIASPKLIAERVKPANGRDRLKITSGEFKRNGEKFNRKQGREKKSILFSYLLCFVASCASCNLISRINKLPIIRPIRWVSICLRFQGINCFLFGPASCTWICFTTQFRFFSLINAFETSEVNGLLRFAINSFRSTPRAVHWRVSLKTGNKTFRIFLF